MLAEIHKYLDRGIIMSNITPSNTPKPKKEPPLIYDFSALNSEGKPVWYFISVPKPRSEEFIAAINQKGVDVDIKQFGTILASGEGENAPEDVRKKVMQEHSAA